MRNLMRKRHKPNPGYLEAYEKNDELCRQSDLNFIRYNLEDFMNLKKRLPSLNVTRKARALGILEGKHATGNLTEYGEMLLAEVLEEVRE